MATNLDQLPDFEVFPITFAEDGPPGFIFVVPGLRIRSTCRTGSGKGNEL